jgi:sugar phosphate isomerase/epimerase
MIAWTVIREEENKMLSAPRYSVCDLSIPDADFHRALDLVSSTGATGISIAETKLAEGAAQASQLAALDASGLTVTGCIPANLAPLPINPPVIYPGPDDPDERIALMCDSVRRLGKLNPTCIAVATGSPQGYPVDRAWEIAARGIREVAKVADRLGTRLALEVIRGDCGFDASFLRSLPEAVEFLDLVDAPNVGLCYDVYHLWDTPDVLRNTETIASRVATVQVSGWRQPPRGPADRLLPGEGPMDLPAILSSLDRGGYDGWFEFELFSDDGRWGTDLPDSLWKLPYDELLTRARLGFERAWAAAHDKRHDDVAAE